MEDLTLFVGGPLNGQRIFVEIGHQSVNWYDRRCGYRYERQLDPACMKLASGGAVIGIFNDYDSLPPPMGTKMAIVDQRIRLVIV